MKFLSNTNIKNSKILMRVDFNVPMNNGEIIDSTRILNVLPTITYLTQNNNAVVLLSHLGRPKKKSDQHSLVPIHKKLVEILNGPVFFCEEAIGKEAEKKKRMLNFGEVLLLENIRFYHEEKKYKNEEEYAENMFFAKKIAQQMDFFINEAFACSHRESTSIKLLPMCFPNKKLAGFLMEKEVLHLRAIKHNSLKPFTAIIGGSKISTKIKLLQKLVLICDNIILGGAMAHTFVVFLEGKIGSSLFEPNQLLEVQKILKKSAKYNCKIHLPLDCITAKKISNNTSTNIRKIMNIPDNEMSVDIGPMSLNLFNKIIMNSKTILWNGPMGIFEFPVFASGTRKIAQFIHKATILGSYSIVGGGDSISAINSFNQEFDFSYVSTGGGAMLEFFEKEKLPGIIALED